MPLGLACGRERWLSAIWIGPTRRAPKGPGAAVELDGSTRNTRFDGLWRRRTGIEPARQLSPPQRF